MKNSLEIFILSLFLLFSVTLLFSQNPSELNRAGAALAEENKYNEALNFFHQSADLYDKEEAVYLHNKAWALELQGKGDEAFDLYDKAFKRNPMQIESIERLGYLHYKKGNYKEAIELGERVSKLDPVNQAVKKWLPDAYKMNLDAAAQNTKIRDFLQKTPEPIVDKKDAVTPKPNEKPQEKKVGDLAAEKKDEKPKEKKSVFGGTFDFGLRYGYNVKGSDYPSYISSPGKILNIPLMLSLWVTPSETIQVETIVGNPYWGAAVPSIVGQHERLEFLLKMSSFSIGTGLWFTHFDSKEAPVTGFSDMSDMKWGFTLKYKDNDSDVTCVLYPRLVIRDTKTYSSGKTLDCDFYEITYRYTADTTMSYYSKFTNYDFYLFNHTSSYSDYWGFFEIAFGLSLNAPTGNIIRGASFSIKYTKRYNHSDLNNTKPYSTFNGQGAFGFNSSGNGGYFKGYRSTSNILRIIASENINTQLFLYQKFHLEIVDRHETNHEFLAQFGAGLSL